MRSIESDTPITWWAAPSPPAASPVLTRYPTTVRPRQMRSDDGVFTKGSISRWMPIRSIVRMRNQGMNTPLSPMVSAALSRRWGRWSVNAIATATTPRRIDWRP